MYQGKDRIYSAPTRPLPTAFVDAERPMVPDQGWGGARTLYSCTANPPYNWFGRPLAFTGDASMVNERDERISRIVLTCSGLNLIATVILGFCIYKWPSPNRFWWTVERAVFVLNGAYSAYYFAKACRSKSDF